MSHWNEIKKDAYLYLIIFLTRLELVQVKNKETYGEKSYFVFISPGKKLIFVTGQKSKKRFHML